MTESDFIKESNTHKGSDTKNREKKEKKSKRKRDDVSENSNIEENEVVDGDRTELKTTASKSKNLLKQRRLERQKLLEQVPKVDENGVSYTKQQIRFMRKRVQKGLHPIETSAERHARVVNEAQIRKEVEAELSGFNNNDDDDDGEDGDANDNEDGDEGDDAYNNVQKGHHDDSATILKTPSTGGATKFDDGGNLIDENNKEEKDGDFSYEKNPNDIMGEPMERRRPMKKKKRDKPVPTDYICSACKGTDNDQPRHWIYDCLYKKNMPGTNQVSRKKRGLQDPLETKLFVSGLPFDTTMKDVTELFSTSTTNNNNSVVAAATAVVHCKLIKFDDTKRCKGQAFVTFATPEAAKQALKLNGTVIQSNTKGSNTTNKKDTTTATKELKLKITKVLNRTLTKKVTGA